MLAPSAGPDDANLSGVSVSYWWGYEPMKSIVDAIESVRWRWIIPYGTSSLV